MNDASGGRTRRVAPPPEAVLLRSLEEAPVAYAATRGTRHILFFANSAFCRLTNLTADRDLDRPFQEMFQARADATWLAFLEQAALHDTATVNASVPALAAVTTGANWICTIWPVHNAAGETEYCVIEVQESAQPDQTLRNVTEQLLLSALREEDFARVAETARSRAVFLSDATRQLSGSLDSEATLRAAARLALPGEGAWCIVDVADAHTMRRLAIIHPARGQQEIAARLENTWAPEHDDFFGLPLAMRIKRAQVIARVTDGMLASAAHGDENHRLLRQLDFYTLLVVPLMARDKVIGAITFVKGQQDVAFEPSDIELAQAVAARCALALDNARMYEQSERLRSEAEQSNLAKSEFLTRMSHELRTPLNAISGYVDLIDLEVHGPVTAEQQADIVRIRHSCTHLLALINELLDYTRIRSGGARYRSQNVMVAAVIGRAMSMLQSLASQKDISCELMPCPAETTARADRDRVEQILVNLISNAIKYTPRGGSVVIACDVLPETIRVRVTDTGVGIASDRLESIFEPFVQIHPVLTRTEGGVGLGLAISRDLAHAMRGELVVESEPGRGSCFTLTLPRAG